MRYAQIRSLDISNGEGVGVALFVQGCHFRCKNCFNSGAWDFDGGKEWTDDVRREFMGLVGREWIRRVSILGGEPLAAENARPVASLASGIRRAYPQKKIWLYTGYTYEELTSGEATGDDALARREVLRYIDVLCDGRYDERLATAPGRGWVGSANQRVIDVGRTLESGSVCLHGEGG